MSSPDDPASALRAKLATYVDPYLGQTLEQAKAIRSVMLQGPRAHVEIAFGFPCADYVTELTDALSAHLGAALGAARLELTLRAEITAHAVQRTLKPLAN